MEKYVLKEGLTTEELENYKDENNIGFIKVYEILDYENDRAEQDVHPGINGNKKTVSLIIDFLKEKGEI